jgi:branched-chain amino acid transport system permease protein
LGEALRERRLFFFAHARSLDGERIILITSALLSGFCLGSMYGLIALGFHITYVVSNTVNFSQGSSVMLGAVLGYTFAVRYGWPLPLALIAALIACAAFGLVVERTLVRPFASRGSNAWLMATVAGGIVLDNAVLFTFGKEPRSFPPLLSMKPVEIFGAGVYPLQLVIPVVSIVIAVTLTFLLRHTRRGKALLAVVQNTDAARLMGINVTRTIAATYALSTALAGLAGLLIAPLFSVHSDMGTLFGIKAFAVAILGGITSASGVMVAGIIYGLVEAMVTALLGSTYTQIVMFTVVIAALALMPNGLFGRAPVKKV